MTASAPRGYDALRNAAAWLDLSDRGKIKASGEDRARLLHAMTTNHIQQLQPGAGCYAYFLSAQGRILADVNLLCRPDHFLLDCEPETREKILKHLDSYIIADDVAIEDLSGALATIALEGPESTLILAKLEAPAPDRDYDNAAWGSRLVARMSFTGGPGFYIIAPAADRDALIEQLRSAGAVEAEREAFRIVRIENGRPRYGDDISERFLAQETNQPRAMHFNKGCYLGQEIVERVRSRGQIHRVLVSIQIDATEPPATGTKLSAEPTTAAPVSSEGPAAPEPKAGEIMSAAWSPAFEKVAALAYVRVDFAKPGARLWLDGKPATVIG